MKWIPCRVSRYLLAVRPVGRTDFLEIPRPFDGVLRASPAWAARHFRPVPFSGLQSCDRFLSTVSWQAQSLQPCFRPHRPWDSSLQGLPLTGDRSRLSTQPGFLVVILRRAGTHDSSPFTCGFPDAHAFTQLPGSPAGYGLPFSRTEARFPVALGLAPRNHPVPPASPTSKLRSLLRVRSRLGRVSSSQSADTLLGFCPSRAFSSHASDPRPAQARGLNTHLRPWTPVRDPEDRSPPCRVRPFLHHE